MSRASRVFQVICRPLASGMRVEEAFNDADQRVVARDIVHGRPALRADVGVLSGIAVTTRAKVVLAWHQCDWPVHQMQQVMCLDTAVVASSCSSDTGGSRTTSGGGGAGGGGAAEAASGGSSQCVLRSLWLR